MVVRLAIFPVKYDDVEVAHVVQLVVLLDQILLDSGESSGSARPSVSTPSAWQSGCLQISGYGGPYIPTSGPCGTACCIACRGFVGLRRALCLPSGIRCTRRLHPRTASLPCGGCDATWPHQLVKPLGAAHELMEEGGWTRTGGELEDDWTRIG